MDSTILTHTGPLAGNNREAFIPMVTARRSVRTFRPNPPSLR